MLAYKCRVYSVFVKIFLFKAFNTLPYTALLQKRQCVETYSGILSQSEAPRSCSPSQLFVNICYLCGFVCMCSLTESANSIISVLTNAVLSLIRFFQVFIIIIIICKMIIMYIFVYPHELCS